MQWVPADAKFGGVPLAAAIHTSTPSSRACPLRLTSATTRQGAARPPEQRRMACQHGKMASVHLMLLSRTQDRRPATLPPCKQMGIVEGILFGVMGAALAAVYLLLAGLARAVVGGARTWLDARIGLWPRVVVLATTGGAAIGALGWAMPLTLTDGAAQLTPVLFKSAQVGGSRDGCGAGCLFRRGSHHSREQLMRLHSCSPTRPAACRACRACRAAQVGWCWPPQSTPSAYSFFLSCAGGVQRAGGLLLLQSPGIPHCSRVRLPCECGRCS